MIKINELPSEIQYQIIYFLTGYNINEINFIKYPNFEDSDYYIYYNYKYLVAYYDYSILQKKKNYYERILLSSIPKKNKNRYYLTFKEIKVKCDSCYNRSYEREVTEIFKSKYIGNNFLDAFIYWYYYKI
jgi:hypothetical protein